MRALLLSPSEPPREVAVRSYRDMLTIMGADAIDRRPMTLREPILWLNIDDDFVQKRLTPTMLHPTYTTQYILCGPIVVTREPAHGVYPSLTDADIQVATRVYYAHCG